MARIHYKARFGEGQSSNQEDTPQAAGTLKNAQIGERLLFSQWEPSMTKTFSGREAMKTKRQTLGPD
jgi:hypothetical protein